MIAASRCVCAAGMLSLLAVSASTAGPASPVIVRAYNTYGVPSREMRTAALTVQRVLSMIPIDMRWRNCGVVAAPVVHAVDQCDDPVARNEVIVRVVAALIPPEPDAPLGDSFIDPVLGTGTLATVYADRVLALSRALDVDHGTLLGRAVGHEIGHLLLGTRRHSGFGLMRALWSRHTILENRSGDWLFTYHQGLAMRSALDARLLARPAHSIRSEQQK
jgi:hypothetical protein